MHIYAMKRGLYVHTDVLSRELHAHLCHENETFCAH